MEAFTVESIAFEIYEIQRFFVPDYKQTWDSKFIGHKPNEWGPVAMGCEE